MSGFVTSDLKPHPRQLCLYTQYALVRSSSQPYQLPAMSRQHASGVSNRVKLWFNIPKNGPTAAWMVENAHHQARSLLRAVKQMRALLTCNKVNSAHQIYMIGGCCTPVPDHCLL